MRTLAEDVDALGRCLGSVIREQEGERVLALEERIRTRTIELRERGQDTSPMQDELAALSIDDAARLVRAFSVYFQLVNLVEEHERIRRLSRREGTRPESIEAGLLEMRRAGLDAAAARGLVAQLDLGLTFTAHPTEMKRRTVRAHLDAISADLDSLDEPGGAARIAAHIEALWTTPQLRARTPSVADEVNAGLAYVDVIAAVLPGLDRDLDEAFARVFGEALGDVGLPISFHSWVGGDRDGNPNVTPEVTRETFATHAKRARTALAAEVTQAFVFMSQATLAEPGAAGAPDDEREPFRRTLEAFHAAVERGEPVDAEEFVAKLEEALRASGQARSADELLRPLRVRARAFSIHLASLDIREHSRETGAAVAELLSRIGLDYLALDEPARVRALEAELATRRPLLAADETPSPSLARVLEPLRAARAATLREGPRAFGSYIVSMSEQPSDLLEVLILAREAGVRVVPVPLFETLDDLARAPRVMSEVLAMPAYRAALGEQVQEVMIGYSDSNKDGGFVAANWALYEAQRRIAERCEAAGVRYRFFHGRGTSIGRGGGPMARALLGQPPATMAHGLRTTEQGEAIGNKYSQPALAHRNLEQGIYGLFAAAARAPSPLEPAFAAAMDRAAAASVAAYRALVDDPGFLAFFEAVTPIGEIARLRIASRPVRRAGAPTLHSLRAIPWVMAWTQCRANVPGWYGLGAGLAAIEPQLAREMYARWPFFRSMLDNAQMSLAKTDPIIFRAYRTLAADDALGRRIEAEFDDSVERVRSVLGGELLREEPVLARSIALRNPYIEPIHRLQVELLRRARAVPEGAPIPQALDRSLLLSLHGISAGMRNTG